MITAYNEILINVYLFKGTHHYIKCINEDEVTFADVGDWETANSELLGVLCTSEFMGWRADTCSGSACSRYQTVYPFYTYEPTFVDNLIINV